MQAAKGRPWSRWSRFADAYCRSVRQKQARETVVEDAARYSGQVFQKFSSSCVCNGPFTTPAAVRGALDDD